MESQNPKRQYMFESDSGGFRAGGEPTEQETAMGENREPLGDEWNPETETWEEFDVRTQ